MASELPEYLVAEKGVNLTQTPLHTPSGGVLEAANVDFIREQGLGGIGTRGGLARLNSSALAGDVLALSNLPFGFPNDPLMMVSLNDATANSWKSTPDGAAFTNLAETTLQRAGVTNPGTLPSLAQMFRGYRPSTFKRKLYYPGENYVPGTSAPPIVVYNGVNGYEAFRVPANPQSSGPAQWISDTLLFNGLLYVSCWDPGGVAPDQRGRVMVYDPVDVSLYQIGNRFGPGAAENTGGFPMCLGNYLGLLYCGSNGYSGNQTGKIWRIQPGIDDTWTLDHSSGLHHGYYMSLATYQGKLFAATSADTSGTARIEQRTQAGVWSDSLVAPSANLAYFGGLATFDSLLFAGYHNSVAGQARVYRYNNVGWTLDLDITTVYGVTLEPGTPFVFEGNLYWPWIGNSDTAADCMLLKRLPSSGGGTWSQVLTATGLRGAMGHYVAE